MPLTARSHTISSEGELEILAKNLSELMPSGSTIGLIGDLGAGKTTFVRFFCKALHSVTPVSSPTYVLQHEYIISSGVVEHWDLYRLVELPEELMEPVPKGSFRLIEWIDKVDPECKLVDFRIEFKMLDGGSRKLLVSS